MKAWGVHLMIVHFRKKKNGASFVNKCMLYFLKTVKQMKGGDN